MQQASGQIWTTKTPSTPHDPSEVFFTGIHKLLQQAEVAVEDIAYVFDTGDDESVLINHGFVDALGKVKTRPGSLVNPTFPASLGMRSNTMFCVNNCIFGTLALATEGQTSAASPVYVIYMLRSLDKRSGAYTLCIEGMAIGCGARPFADGIDAVYDVAQKNYPIEFAEMEFGVQVERYAIHQDSGGPGFYRGGCGVVRDIRIIADEGILASRLENVIYPAWGVNGGHSGRPGGLIVNPGTPSERALRPLSDNNRLEKGDLLRINTPGGGGWGKPLDRDPLAVQADVLDGFISLQSAPDDYGVVLEPETMAIDETATVQRRNALRGEATMFHRGRYLTELASSPHAHGA